MKKSIIILLSAVFLLSGCKLTNFFKSERDRIIAANSEALCVLVTSADTTAPSEETSKKIQEIYSNYGFDSENEEAMQTILDKYKDDKEANEAIAVKVNDCSGINITDLAPADTAATETPQTEVTPTTEQPVK